MAMTMSVHGFHIFQWEWQVCHRTYAAGYIAAVTPRKPINEDGPTLKLVTSVMKVCPPPPRSSSSRGAAMCFVLSTPSPPGLSHKTTGALCTLYAHSVQKRTPFCTKVFLESCVSCSLCSASMPKAQQPSPGRAEMAGVRTAELSAIYKPCGNPPVICNPCGNPPGSQGFRLNQNAGPSPLHMCYPVQARSQNKLRANGPSPTQIAWRVNHVEFSAQSWGASPTKHLMSAKSTARPLGHQRKYVFVVL